MSYCFSVVCVGFALCPFHFWKGIQRLFVDRMARCKNTDNYTCIYFIERERHTDRDREMCREICREAQKVEIRMER